MDPEVPERTVVLPWAGLQVTRVAFDFQTRLLFEDGAELVLEAPFVLTGPAGADTVVPEEPATLAPALALVRQTAASAEVAADGTLEVAFTGGTVLRVPTDPRYESWTATGPGWNGHGPGDWMVVDTPGGGLAIWGQIPAS